MARITVHFEFNDQELENAIKFLGAKDPAGIQAIKDEYLTGAFTMDLRKVSDDQKRYYHTNGLTAMLISIQDEIQNA